MRSFASGWRKGSIVAVDAGVHLSAITRILEQTLPEGLGTTDELLLPHTLQHGPFAGFEVQHASAGANAAEIHRNLIDTYLITHPHLDHIAGFVINTAGLPGTRPKRLAGLPGTISAFKTHIFNNVIWPNLSDENNGAGLVTYMRLNEGGSPALGEGDGKGYLELTDGLAIKVWGVSHGHCIEKHSHRGSGSSTRFGSMDASSGAGMSFNTGMLSPRSLAHHNSSSVFLQQQPGQERSPSILPGSSAPSGGNGRSSLNLGAAHSPSESVCVYDSSAYFIRDVYTGREVLIFGDVEPDSISLSPRNQNIWQEAAPKIATGKLAAIFIESSYDDSQSVDRLFGHLTPRFVIEEMTVLAGEVESARAAIVREAKEARERKKRKREGDEGLVSGRRKTATSGPRYSGDSGAGEDPVSPKTVKPGERAGSQPSIEEHMHGFDSPHIATPTAELSLKEAELGSSIPSLSDLVTASSGPPLKGLTVVVIHVKDKGVDGLQTGDKILEELKEHDEEAQLGCKWIISHPGQSLYF